MAIDDNTVYGLTGAQVKELPEKIEAVKGLAKELTSADYNWPTNNPDGVAIWELDTGIYTHASGVKVYYTSSIDRSQSCLFAVHNNGYQTSCLYIRGANANMEYYDVNNANGGVREYFYISQPVNNLTSSSEYAPLSAAQGKVLKDMIDNLPTGGAIELTSADYNWPTSNPTSVALWLLDNGMYVAESDSVNVSISYNKTGLGNGIALVKQLDNENPSRANVVVLKDDSSAIYYGMTADGRNASQYNLSNPTPVQIPGTSTTDIMSQNAVTSMVYADPNTKTRVRIGDSTLASANNTVAIGNSSMSQGARCVAIGNSAYIPTNVVNSVALGYRAQVTRTGEVNIGTGNELTAGFNSSNYRVLGGLYDGQNDHDAVTVSQVNSVIDNINSALSTNIPHIGA